MTKTVRIGNVIIGGGNKIAVQSMTNTKTYDIDATVAQIVQLQNAGCDIVRCSVPDLASANAIAEIKRNIAIPMVADIHFDYKLAIKAVEGGIDKVRINPGNIGDESKVKYLADLFNERGIPVRIGVNAGSLEKEFASLENKPNAMLQSALRHIAMLERAGFYNTVISVKASSVRETISAYRLLSAAVDYPLHLGVTEAGIYERGIIKSAIGIGSLLSDGIGDTIRVSLTDKPIEEIFVGRRILQSVGLDNDFAEIISCPTCARTDIDVQGIAEKVAKATIHIKKPLKIAVMGCVVNGPGEASHCDFGVAGGKDKSVIFVKGKIVKTVQNNDILNELLKLVGEYS